MKKIIFILLSVSILCFLGACTSEKLTQIETTNMSNTSSKVATVSEPIQDLVSPSPSPTPDVATMPPYDSEFDIETDTITQTDETNFFGADPSTWCGSDPDRMR